MALKSRARAGTCVPPLEGLLQILWTCTATLAPTQGSPRPELAAALMPHRSSIHTSPQVLWSMLSAASLRLHLACSHIGSGHLATPSGAALNPQTPRAQTLHTHCPRPPSFKAKPPTPTSCTPCTGPTCLAARSSPMTLRVTLAHFVFRGKGQVLLSTRQSASNTPGPRTTASPQPASLAVPRRSRARSMSWGVGGGI